ncbi:hypothetical protein JIG36_36755 [Actinoplanes sp. LDG1-06]|uniref:Uncharacterized protein n=1 Tax=Paractinoplanes ovalisporus TaxID=2810368 RepID=A0ABS2AP91_9ACTN|nr:hypothetical protein [Actinoplanes ovalisporus]MBM2621066.1 hypothetical protein [Actinoplanes ovalisporus]
MTGTQRRHPVPDRARRRAIRTLAAQLGVAYSVAARLLANEHRALVFAQREQRPFHARVRDTHEAVELPLGRAAHISARFPRLLTTVGVLYDGPHRSTILAMLYATLLHESPSLRPETEELQWVAELGEEAAVDITCGALDRAARLLLDEDPWRLWTRIESALTAGESGADRRVRDVAITLNRELRTVSLRGSLPGTRQTLDALLVEPYQGHAPGARLGSATVVGVRWPRSGPPSAYETRRGGDAPTQLVPTGREPLGV